MWQKSLEMQVKLSSETVHVAARPSLTAQPSLDGGHRSEVEGITTIVLESLWVCGLMCSVDVVEVMMSWQLVRNAA